ncbi:SDR family NAD(P)-dependent oxidoreductase [Microbacterium hominis]|uniref:SDR family NAD(P)-dependent oxidoreductase n=1 Tax=Microbacterium hominis TaxID=162426 RepID=A0A7D4UHG0_9MICO|nr:SDR family NAD(P)-dependent oxidoreductase [Microbacterium hominis]QKJ20809.1 SDR family NAD(P)-dependent oxidoreductase [Microbacterium hominis]
MANDAWDPRRLPDLSGRTYLVTGGNRGLGYFSCEQLIGAGARVIMTGRSATRLQSARAALRKRVDADPSAIETMLLDTANLGSVRAAAASIRSRKKLDGLLLNAGIVHPPKERTTSPEGHEIVFATNVLGHFALAAELLTILASASGRMVWVGSLATKLTPYDPMDPELRTGYTPWRAYAQSKIATTALGLEADRRLRVAGVRVASIVAHPGYSVSGRTVGIRDVNEPTRGTRFTDSLQMPITQSKEHGAWSLVRALVDPTIGGGEFWGPQFGPRGEPKRGTPAKITREPAVGERLWEHCERASVPWPMSKAARRRRR